MRALFKILIALLISKHNRHSKIPWCYKEILSLKKVDAPTKEKTAEDLKVMHFLKGCIRRLYLSEIHRLRAYTVPLRHAPSNRHRRRLRRSNLNLLLRTRELYVSLYISSVHMTFDFLFEKDRV